MNNDNIYKLKYVKYKTKYINLLNQHGGLCENDNNSPDCIKKKEVDQIINLIKYHDCKKFDQKYYDDKKNDLNKIYNEVNDDIKKYINDIAIPILNKKRDDCKNPNLQQLPGRTFIPPITNIQNTNFLPTNPKY